jgi:hypothetical protein
MKEEWTLIEDNDGKRYKRIINDMNYCIHELSKDAFELSYGGVIINYLYRDFESTEKEAIKIATEHLKFEEDMKKLQEGMKLDVLKFNFDTLKYEHAKMSAKELGTVYISGKMDGLSKEEYVKRFKEVEQVLVWQGVENILNPVKFKMQFIIKENNIDKADLFNPKYRNLFMREDIKQLIKADTICMIYDYKDSLGAMTEYSIAKALDMNIIHFPWKCIIDWQNEWYKDEV